MTAHRFNYSEELAHVKVVINCRNSIAQMCTREDLLARLCSMYCHTIRFLRSPLKVLLVFCPPPPTGYISVDAQVLFDVRYYGSQYSHSSISNIDLLLTLFLDSTIYDTKCNCMAYKCIFNPLFEQWIKNQTTVSSF